MFPKKTSSNIQFALCTMNYTMNKCSSLTFLCHPRVYHVQKVIWSFWCCTLLAREFQAGLLCRQQFHFEKIDKIVDARTMHVMLQRVSVCVCVCVSYIKKLVLMRPFIYWVESGEWESGGDWWRLLIDIMYCILYKVLIGSEVMVIDI